MFTFYKTDMRKSRLIAHGFGLSSLMGNRSARRIRSGVSLSVPLLTLLSMLPELRYRGCTRAQSDELVDPHIGISTSVTWLRKNGAYKSCNRSLRRSFATKIVSATCRRR